MKLNKPRHAAGKAQKERDNSPNQSSQDLSERIHSEKKAPFKIARKEWDFDTNSDGSSRGYAGCPDDELRFCRIYEYARESKGLKEAVQASHKSNDLMFIYDGDFRIVLLLCYFKKLFPEWPNDPWLKIPVNQRQGRCEELIKRRVDERSPIIELSDLSGLDVNSRTRIIDKENPAVHWELDGKSAHRVVVNWGYTNAQLSKSFSEWLIANRPESCPEGSAGGKSALDPSVIRSKLRNLGALRLVRALGGIAKAVEYVRMTLKAGAEMQAALPNWDERSWRRGKNEAMDSLKNIVGPFWGDEDLITPYCKDNKMPLNPSAEKVWSHEVDEESEEMIVTEQREIRTFILR